MCMSQIMPGVVGICRSGAEEGGAFFAEELGGLLGFLVVEGALFEFGEDGAPLFFGGEVAVVAGDKFFEDAAFEFVPARAVAAIDFTVVGDEVLVVGVVVD